MPATDPPIRDVRRVGGRAPSIFAHFFDIHFLKEKGIEHIAAYALNEARLAVRFALLLADELLVPTPSYYEGTLCESVLAEYEPQIFSDQIFLVGSGSGIEEFSEEKLRQYSRSEDQWASYANFAEKPLFPWRTRFRSATQDIAADWRRRVENDELSSLSISPYDPRPKGFEKRLEDLPDLLGGKAFIVKNVAPILFGTRDISLTTENRLHGILNPSYFRSYIDELGSAVVQNLAFLDSPSRLPSGDPNNDLDYRSLVRECRKQGILKDVDQIPTRQLLSLRQDLRFIAAAVAAIGPDPFVDAKVQLMEVETANNRIWSSGRGGNVEATCKVLVVTALPEEKASMLAMFDRHEPAGSHADGNIYTYGFMDRDDRPARHVLLVSASDMGKVNAAALTTNALRSFPDIQHVFLIGIGGGCPNPLKPEEHVRLGDIVVSNDKGIFEYDDIKLTEATVERRGNRARPSYAMLQAFAALESRKQLGERPWEAHIEKGLSKLSDSEFAYDRPSDATDILYSGDAIIPHPSDPRRRVGVPRIHGGAIGSADILLKNSHVRDELAEKYGVKAIEMEGSGASGAAWALGRDVFVIRGISDYCDLHKADGWRYYAALAAAGYARAMIEILPDEWFR